MRTKLKLHIFIAVLAINIFAMAACDTGGMTPEGGGTPDVIDIAAIPGVTAPVKGGTPVTAITATATRQYIQTQVGTMTSMLGQVYDLSYNKVGSQTLFNTNNTYTTESLTKGQAYYIRVWPSSSSQGGTYSIRYY
jgi:hypothetical protein